MIVMEFMNLKKQKAFTLAEVLITLGIIGVVASLTLPTLVNGYRRKVTETRLAHTYSVISQVFKRAEADYGPMADWGLGSGGINSSGATVMNSLINTYMLPYLDGATVKRMSQGQFGRKAGILYADGKTYWDQNSTGTFFILKNGVTLNFGSTGVNSSDGTSLSLRIYVDINGAKEPNMLGKDIFTMDVSYYDGVIELTGERSISYNDGVWTVTRNNRADMLNACKKSSNAGLFGCGALIRADGWKIPKDYPFKI